MTRIEFDPHGLRYQWIVARDGVLMFWDKEAVWGTKEWRRWNPKDASHPRETPERLALWIDLKLEPTIDL